MSQRMGFEGIIKKGTAGSTAATQLTNVTDITYNLDPDKGNTTVRGSGSAVPIETEDVVALKVSIEFTMVNDDTDTNCADLKSAAYSGAARAIRTLDYAAGKGFDGDCTISIAHDQKLKGEQTITFKATPTRNYGRTPGPYT